MAQDPQVAALAPMVGSWSVEASHPAFEGTVGGRSVFEWLEGEQFLVQRATTEHPDVPDSIAVMGVLPEGLAMHYFDSRGIHRVYRMAMDDSALRIWRDHHDFSQRFVGIFKDDGNTIDGLWELAQEDGKWNEDLRITYRRDG
jgi:hypothetical protein